MVTEYYADLLRDIVCKTTTDQMDIAADAIVRNWILYDPDRRVFPSLALDLLSGTNGMPCKVDPKGEAQKRLLEFLPTTPVK